MAADPWAEFKPAEADPWAEFKPAGPRMPMVASHAPPSRLEAAARGLAQGGTAGFSDELAGLVGGAGVTRKEPSLVVPASVLRSAPAYAQHFEATRPDIAGAQTSEADRAARQEAYRASRDLARAKNEAAQQAHPGTYLASQVAGAVLPTLAGTGPLTGTKAAMTAAGQGMAQGAGYSNADAPIGLARDTALGGALGLAGYGAGQILGQGTAALSRKASEKLGLASARAGSQAAKEVAEDVASKVGQVGAETQKGSRYVENLMRLRESMTPQQLAQYEVLVKAGVVPNLQQSVAQGTLEALPGQAGTIAAKRAALEAAQQAAPQTVLSRTNELLTPQVGADARSFLKSYAEPILWAYGANKAGEMAGLSPEHRLELAAAAGIIGGRTRAGKALWTRINRPGNQAVLARAMERAAQTGTALQNALPVAAPAAAIPLLLSHEKQQ